MKKIISIIMILALILSMATVVNADSTVTLKVSVDQPTVKVGDTVTVTIDFGRQMESADIFLNYDSEILEYTGNTLASGDFLSVENNQVKIVWIAIMTGGETASEVKYTFTARKEGTVNFTLESEQTAFEGVDENEIIEDLTGAKVTVLTTPTPTPTPVPTPTPTPETTPTPVPTAKPTPTPVQTNQPTGTTKPTEKPSETTEPTAKPSETTKPTETAKPEKEEKPKEIPQAGVNYVQYIVIGLVALSIVATVVIVKNRKNK